MDTLDELLALRDQDLDTVAKALGANPEARESGGYEGLEDVELIDTPDDAMIVARGDQLALVYVGSDSLPEGVDHDALAAAVGSTGEALRSREGKRAKLHVVADRGIAWSEQGGEVGFVELFPPMDFDTYKSQIYEDPGPFIR